MDRNSWRDISTRRPRGTTKSQLRVVENLTVAPDRCRFWQAIYKVSVTVRQETHSTTPPLRCLSINRATDQERLLGEWQRRRVVSGTPPTATDSLLSLPNRFSQQVLTTDSSTELTSQEQSTEELCGVLNLVQRLTTHILQIGGVISRTESEIALRSCRWDIQEVCLA